MKIETQIKLLRESKNISREQMSDYLVISLNTYKKIESGERSPTHDELVKIAEKCEEHPSYFYPIIGSSTIKNGDYFPGLFRNGNFVQNDTSQIFSIILENQKAINSLISKQIEMDEKVVDLLEKVIIK